MSLLILFKCCKIPSQWGILQYNRLRIQTLLLILVCLCNPFIAMAASDDPLLMGIFPRRNSEVTHKLFLPMADYLSKELNREVQLVLSKNFSSFWLGVKNRRYDIVHFSQYHYLKSNKDQGYQVILHNQEFGRNTLASTLLVRKNSGIESLNDLKGKSILFGGGPKAFIAYIGNRYQLQQAGIKQDMYRSFFAKNPPNAAVAVFAGEATAAGTGDHVLQLKGVKNAINVEEMRVLSRGEQFTHLPWAVKETMPNKLRDRIQQLLAELSESERGQNILKAAHLTGLIASKDSDYKRHREVVIEVLGENF